jgi:hypothetical protein
MAVAVTEPSDISVETPVTEVVLRPGESKSIPVTVKRAEKYKTGPVTLWSDRRFGRNVFGNALPPGVALDPRQSVLTLNGSSTEGKLTLKADANAKPAENVQTAIIAQVAIEFSVFVPYSTAPIAVTVLPKE